MDRRSFIEAAIAFLAVALAAGNAQRTNRIHRIGVLITYVRPSNPWWDTFIQRMREDGWVEHQNFVTVLCSTEGQTVLTPWSR